jgi:hypothetical protein
MIKNKRGWIEIVEAFVAVLLVVGVVLIVLNKGYLQKTDISERVYEAELSILREIQTNTSLRTKILDAPEPLPIAWEDARFPVEVKDKIIQRTPNYLDCIGRICNMTQTCNLEDTKEAKEKDIYSQSVTITSTLQTLSYRKLNLFCWIK